MRTNLLALKPYLSVRDVAQVLGLPERKVYYWLTIARLPGCKLGGTWIVPSERLRLWLQAKVNQALAEKKAGREVDLLLRDKHLVVQATVPHRIAGKRQPIKKRRTGK